MKVIKDFVRASTEMLKQSYELNPVQTVLLVVFSAVFLVWLIV